MRKAATTILVMLSIIGTATTIVMLFLRNPADALAAAIASYIPAYTLAHISKN